MAFPLKVREMSPLVGGEPAEWPVTLAVGMGGTRMARGTRIRRIPRSASVPAVQSGDADSKATDAFRTIAEVSTQLDVPKHVLRFWEGRFSQLKPMKRGGGRRFYRPEDVELLLGIRHLLHNAGYTIRGVQQLLRKNGIDWVKKAGAGQIDVPQLDASVKVAGRGADQGPPRKAQLEALAAEIRQCLAILGAPRRSEHQTEAPAATIASRRRNRSAA
jgi:DNA-binding transcriptional MerR regulator